jgi:hypothetical protein
MLPLARAVTNGPSTLCDYTPICQYNMSKSELGVAYRRNNCNYNFIQCGQLTEGKRKLAHSNGPAKRTARLLLTDEIGKDSSSNTQPRHTLDFSRMS